MNIDRFKNTITSWFTAQYSHKYTFFNNAVGWFTFLIALITYFLTLEPTVSFWDCGEFIAAAYKIQIGHPPGAPFYMILGRMASLFASDSSQVALMINGLSAVASAFTILFLFWTITHLAKKLFFVKGKEISTAQMIAILGAGFVGGLAYTFSDTFWFSAVEAEVYAMSSLFTALVFWAILKWEDASKETYADRWLLFIAYLVGLSTGVHLLNLLVIPAVGYIFYYKNYKVTKRGLIKTFIVSSLILVGVMYGIIQGLIIFAEKVELLFVNSFGLPYNSGAFFFIFLLIAGIVWGLYHTHKKNLLQWNTIVLCFAMIIIGYSTFTIIPIRSASNPPTDTNNPENVFNLRKYVNREQYGDRPLIYGHSFNSQTSGHETKSPIYAKENSRYVSRFYSTKYTYASKDKTFFPRMYSTEGPHKREFTYWGKIDLKRKTPPSFIDNMRFFLKYQCGQMYMRYFLWNFAGRQNNVYVGGRDNYFKGNWISGIPFIDEARLGPQHKLPTKQKNQKSRNKYYFLPLILGLIGMYFQLSLKQKGKRSFWIVFLLFFFTGLAIVIYLNQTPVQPRERDYAYAGSFYAFSIWIGFGVLGVYRFLKDKLAAKVSAIAATAISFLLVPLIMASENWDDHDRSGRYFAHNAAYNYMQSCKKNAILFTYGDNDTFPLWYIQDVEYLRPDIRLCNLSYLSSGWYTEQMDRKAYESDPMPFTLTKKQYQSGSRKVVYLFEHPVYKKRVEKQGGLDMHQAILFLKSDNPRTKHLNASGGQRQRVDYLPAKKFFIPVDKIKAIKNGFVSPNEFEKIVDKLFINYSGKRYLIKNNIMALDAISGCKWERPVYFSSTIGASNMQGLKEYTRLEGFAYSLVPVKTPSDRGRIGGIDADLMYDYFMNKFKWRAMDDPNVLLEITNGDMVILYNIRAHFLRLIETLVKEKKHQKAKHMLDKYFSIYHPDRTLNMSTHDRLGLNILRFYRNVGETEKGVELARIFAKHLLEEVEYYFSLREAPTIYASSKNERDSALRTTIFLTKYVLREFRNVELRREIDDKLNNLFQTYNQRYEIKRTE